LKKKIFATTLALTLALLEIVIMLSGCASSAVAAGWAGVTVSGDSVYTISSQGQLVALSLADLTKTNWTAAVEGVASSGGFLGCSASSTIVAVYGTPVVSGDTVYVAGYNGKVYSYSISKQSESSNILLDQDDSKPIVGGPVVDQGKVFVASSNGNLYALDATTLAQIWKFPTGNKIWSTPAVDNGTVFVGSFDKKVYAVDEATGNKKWSFNTQGAIIATPVIDNGTVYVASFDRHIYALDEATGNLKWQYPAAGAGDGPRQWFWATPVISEGFLYAPCLDGKVYAVSTANSSNVVVFNLGKSISAAPVVSDGQVIAATEDGKIFSLMASTSKQTLLMDLKKIEIIGSDNKTITPNNAVVNSALSEHDGVVLVHALQPDVLYAIDLASNIPTHRLLSGSGSATTVTTPVTVTTTITAPPVTITTTVTTTLTVTVTATK
jgi:outer membrane protein assembly factor BamB